jgi:hypothetical protein
VLYVPQEMLSYKNALIATVIAWLCAVSMFASYSYAIIIETYWPDIRITELIIILSYIGLIVGIVVIPSCFIIIALLICALPIISRKWRQLCASFIGAIMVPITIYLYDSIFQVGLSNLLSC